MDSDKVVVQIFYFESAKKNKPWVWISWLREDKKKKKQHRSLETTITLAPVTGGDAPTCGPLFLVVIFYYKPFNCCISRQAATRLGRRAPPCGRRYSAKWTNEGFPVLNTGLTKKKKKRTRWLHTDVSCCPAFFLRVHFLQLYVWHRSVSLRLKFTLTVRSTHFRSHSNLYLFLFQCH